LANFLAGAIGENSIYLVGNPSGSFLYILTGLHGLHIISAIVFLLIMLSASFTGKVHSGNMTKNGMCTTYWHFLGGLWLYCSSSYYCTGKLINMSQSTATTVPGRSVWDGGVSPMGVSYGKLMMWFFLLSDAFTFSGL